MKPPKHNLKSHMAIKTRKKKKKEEITSRKMENKTKKIR